MESALYVPQALLLRQIMTLGPPILLSLETHDLYLHQVMSPKTHKNWHVYNPFTDRHTKKGVKKANKVEKPNYYIT